MHLLLNRISALTPLRDDMEGQKKDASAGLKSRRCCNRQNDRETEEGGLRNEGGSGDLRTVESEQALALVS